MSKTGLVLLLVSQLLVASPAGAIGVDGAMIVAKLTEEINVIIKMYNQMKDSYDALNKLKKLNAQKAKASVHKNRFSSQAQSTLSLDPHQASSQQSSQERNKALARRMKEIKKQLEQPGLPALKRNQLIQEHRAVVAEAEAIAQQNYTEGNQLGEKEALNQLVRNTAMLLEKETRKESAELEEQEASETNHHEDMTFFLEDLATMQEQNNRELQGVPYAQ